MVRPKSKRRNGWDESVSPMRALSPTITRRIGHTKADKQIEKLQSQMETMQSDCDIVQARCEEWLATLQSALQVERSENARLARELQQSRELVERLRVASVEEGQERQRLEEILQGEVHRRERAETQLYDVEKMLKTFVAIGQMQTGVDLEAGGGLD
eukprot:TRINITY_DN41322_c0_g1_i2.p1 TRINITY_DN41322_c0_g1~~TRINITY_DN41322_c0_g1_i2.p1  ORF type:complete len:157 (-),score=30.58 TRINITY_DN41322_c0_g1_i2:267-737(-)